MTYSFIFSLADKLQRLFAYWRLFRIFSTSSLVT